VVNVNITVLCVATSQFVQQLSLYIIDWYKTYTKATVYQKIYQ